MSLLSRSKVALSGAFVLSLIGCSGAENGPSEESASRNDEVRWHSSDTPSTFSDELTYELSELPKSGAANVAPWAGNYWPTYQDNLNYRWDGKDSDSPAKKFEKAFNKPGLEDKISKEFGIESNANWKVCKEDSECNKDTGEKCAKRTDAEEGRCIPTWFGICHSWAPAAILEPEPQKPVTKNGVTFKVNDIKALVSLMYEDVTTKFVSRRCDEHDKQGQVKYDRWGRPTGSTVACRDTNPGTFHLLVANYLGIKHESFVEDRTFDSEVWNQPVRDFEVKSLKEVSAKEANELIGVSEGAESQEESGKLKQNEWKHLPGAAVVAGRRVVVNLKGSGDADLFVAFDSQPTASKYACRPYLEGSVERSELTVPEGASQLFVSVNGYAAESDYELHVERLGEVPADYEFNADAKRFFAVQTRLGYITESPAHLDGNLASVINTYTHYDTYDYVLELDDAGKIIGGEWVGASKKNHPDFLWLPTKLNTKSVAGGDIRWETVKELLNESIGAKVETKQESFDVNIAKDEWAYLGPFYATAGSLSAKLSGSGDGDLYVRLAEKPSLSSYDCRPWKNGSAESCDLSSAGKYYVAVHGYAAAQGKLEVSYKVTSTTAPEPPAPVASLNESGNLSVGEWAHFELPVSAGKAGRVDPGDYSPGTPTDPDVRNSRIRLLESWVRYAIELL